MKYYIKMRVLLRVILPVPGYGLDRKVTQRYLYWITTPIHRREI
jgi:hypothetical protein